MDYTVLIRKSAQKDIALLLKNIQHRVVDKISSLASDPRPSGCKKLKAFSKECWRIRVGDWRILYTIDDNGKIVIVAAVKSRQSAYRK